jgi:hypothetical protein
VREIFRYPKEIILLAHRIAEERLCDLLLLERTSFLIRREFRLSQFFHFCLTRDIGWSLCWNRQLRPTHRSCGLLERLDSDVEFNLIKDEKLGGNEPDCETNQERLERE